jgi:hypothetical protein
MDPTQPAGGQVPLSDLIHCSPAAVEIAEFQYLVAWHAQRGHFQTIERLAGATVKREQHSNLGSYGGGPAGSSGPTGPFTLESIARFWYAFALTSLGKRSDAIRELNQLRAQPHFGLAVTAALITTHKAKDSASGAAGPAADVQEMSRLKDELKQQTRAASDDGFVLASLYFWHSAKIKQAKHCVDKVLERAPGFYPALVAAGFIYLATGFARHERRALQYATLALETFEHLSRAAAAAGAFAALAGGASSGGGGSKALPALLARAYALEQQAPAQLSAAMADYNALIVLWPQFQPALCDKSRLQVKLGAWEDALSGAARVLARDPQNLAALQIELLGALTRDVDTAAALRRAEALLLAIDAQEPAAHALYACAGRVLTSWAGGRDALLDVAKVYFARATAAAPLLSAYHADAGTLAAAQRDYVRATVLFRDASNLDQDSVEALYGKILCRVHAGEFKEAVQELEFLQEIENAEGDEGGAAAGGDDAGAGAGGEEGGDSTALARGALAGRNVRTKAQAVYLRGIIAWRYLRDEARAAEHLLTVVKTATAALQQLESGALAGTLALYHRIPLDLVTNAAEILVAFAGDAPQHASEEPSPVLTAVCKCLDSIVAVAPGAVCALATLARARTLLRDFTLAERAVAQLQLLLSRAGADADAAPPRQVPGAAPPVVPASAYASAGAAWSHVAAELCLTTALLQVSKPSATGASAAAAAAGGAATYLRGYIIVAPGRTGTLAAGVAGVGPGGSGAPSGVGSESAALPGSVLRHAAGSLDQARAYDFNVPRRSSLYHALQVRLAEAEAEARGGGGVGGSSGGDVLRLLQAATALPGVRVYSALIKSTGGAQAGAGTAGGGVNARAGSAAEGAFCPLSLSDATSVGGVYSTQQRLNLLTALATAHMEAGQQAEALRVMQELQQDFAATAQAAAARARKQQAANPAGAAQASAAAIGAQAELHRFTLAEADIALKRREDDLALSKLGSIPSESPYALRAKVLVADIFLTRKRSKRAYLQCYSELAQQQATPRAYIALADAYSRVQEPALAVKAFEQSLQLALSRVSTATLQVQQLQQQQLQQQAQQQQAQQQGGAAASSSQGQQQSAMASALSTLTDAYALVTHLTARIGSALVTAHDYAQAVQYYETAFATHPTHMHLCHDLAHLYIDIRNLASAERLLADALQANAARRAAASEGGVGAVMAGAQAGTAAGASGVAAAAATLAMATGSAAGGFDQLLSVQADVQSHLLLAHVHVLRGQLDQAEQELLLARQLQQRVVELAKPGEQRLIEVEVSAGISLRLAEHCLAKHKPQVAREHLEAVLEVAKNNKPARLALARLAVADGEYEAATAHCMSLLAASAGSNASGARGANNVAVLASAAAGATATAAALEALTESVLASDHDVVVMLADLKFRLNDPASAMLLFQTLLRRNPTNFYALSQYLVLLHRAGHLAKSGAGAVKAADHACGVPSRLTVSSVCGIAPAAAGARGKAVAGALLAGKGGAMTGGAGPMSAMSSASPASIAAVHASMPAGLWYCKGLYAFLMHDTREALFCFNNVRLRASGGKGAAAAAAAGAERGGVSSSASSASSASAAQIIALTSTGMGTGDLSHAEWAALAMMNMVEVYLEPDLTSLSGAGAALDRDRVQNAEDLLRELIVLGVGNVAVTQGVTGGGRTTTAAKGSSGAIFSSAVASSPYVSASRFQVLEAYVDMATRQKPRIEKALASLMSLIRVDRDHPAANLAVAFALFLLDQTPKARNQLKRIAKLRVQPEFSAEHERCALMLARIYAESGKPDSARELCVQCLQMNKSHANAYEVLGGLQEADNDARAAAESYELAWKFSNEVHHNVFCVVSSLSIGF